MKVWQIATGEPGRDYRDLFLDHDIMIMGPSNFGDALLRSYAVGSANSSYRQVHNFAYGPKQGDRVLMRFAHEVIGVGQIPPEDEYQYSFDETFGCVYGWDLCHCRRVIWAEKYELGDLALVYRTAKQKPTFTQVHEQHIVILLSYTYVLPFLLASFLSCSSRFIPPIGCFRVSLSCTFQRLVPSKVLTQPQARTKLKSQYVK